MTNTDNSIIQCGNRIQPSKNHIYNDIKEILPYLEF